MHVKLNMEARSRSHFCGGKQEVLHNSVCVRVRACVCVCVCVCRGWVWVDYAGARAYACERLALLIPQATRKRHIVCDFSGSTKCFNIIS
jgi:hypothetical protein